MLLLVLLLLRLQGRLVPRCMGATRAAPLLVGLLPLGQLGKAALQF